MSTLTRKQKQEMLVYGYIRECMNKLSINVPIEIMKICFTSYYEVSLKVLANEMTSKWDSWDSETKHSAITIDKNNKYLIKRSDDGYNPYIFGTKIINKSGISIWRFKIHKVHAYFIGILP